jgi:methyl-accepting chemotaxis protein
MKKEKRPRKKSIKFNLIVLPISVLFVTLSVIALSASGFNRVSLLTLMREASFIITNYSLDRLSENQLSLDTINGMLEDKIKVAADLVLDAEFDLSNEEMKKIARIAGVDELYYYNAQGEITYTADAYLGWVAPPDHPVSLFLKSNDRVLYEEIRKDSDSDNYLKYGYAKTASGGLVQVGIDAARVHALSEAFSYQSLVTGLTESDSIVYALFIDKNALAIAHSNEERIGLDLSTDPGTQKALNGERYGSEYFYEAEEVPVYDVLVPWIVDGEILGALNIGVSMKSVYVAISQILLIIISLGVGGFILLGSVLFKSSNGAIKTLLTLKNATIKMEHGDFSEPIESKLLRKKDEFGDIANAISKMQLTMKDIISHIHTSSLELASSSEELSAMSEQSSAVSSEVARTIEEISKGASDQAKDTELGAHAVNELGELIMQNSANMEQLNHSANEVSTLKDQGFIILDELVEKTTISSQASKEVHEVILSTNESASKISNASEMIKSIADQTNLLALNASIEAARAGDAGRGFAVVAEEIRKLAEQSTTFTQQISGVIKELTGKIQTAVATMSEMEHIVASQSESTLDTKAKFDGIASAMKNMEAILTNVNTSSAQMNAKKEEIIGVIDNLSAISEENAAGTEEAAASVEEQTASMIEIADSSITLAKIAEQLKEQVMHFKI